MDRLSYEFFRRPCPEVAQALVGKLLVHQTPQGTLRLRISETEVYCGAEDTACHAHKGKTKRTEVLWDRAGTVYVYLCYGMHWMMNIVTGEAGEPQAVLIRACVEAPGPGRLTKALGITGANNRDDVTVSPSLWIEDDGARFEILPDKRVGIGYASEEDRERLWRYKMGRQL